MQRIIVLLFLVIVGCYAVDLEIYSSTQIITNSSFYVNVSSQGQYSMGIAPCFGQGVTFRGGSDVSPTDNFGLSRWGPPSWSGFGASGSAGGPPQEIYHLFLCEGNLTAANNVCAIVDIYVTYINVLTNQLWYRPNLTHTGVQGSYLDANRITLLFQPSPNISDTYGFFWTTLAAPPNGYGYMTECSVKRWMTRFNDNSVRIVDNLNNTFTATITGVPCRQNFTVMIAAYRAGGGAGTYSEHLFLARPEFNNRPCQGPVTPGTTGTSGTSTNGTNSLLRSWESIARLLFFAFF